jgi:hypothetical protein
MEQHLVMERSNLYPCQMAQKKLDWMNILPDVLRFKPQCERGKRFGDL